MALSPDALAALETHVPELRYHPLEPYFADAAETMTDSFVPSRYSNELRRPEQGTVLARANPTGMIGALSLALLKAEGEPYFPDSAELSEKGDCLHAHGSTLVEDSQRMHELPGYGDVVYGRVYEADGVRWLQYWLFYYFNPHGRLGIGPHQGDWEMVQVAVFPDGRKEATYARHGHPHTRPWDQIETVGDGREIPVVYVAKGSHGSYFNAGEFKRLLFGLGTDYTSDKGERVRPRLRVLDDSLAWLKWPGRWGSTMDMTDKSPRGPAIERGEWDRPDEFQKKGVENERAQAASATALAEEEPAGAPTTPAIEPRVAAGRVVAAYTFPFVWPEGTTVPVRLELGVRGRSGPSFARSFDVTAIRAEVELGLPAAAGPYVLEGAVYDEAGGVTAIEPIPLAAPAPPGPPTGGVALEEAVPALGAPPPGPVRRTADLEAEPIVLLVRAPEGGREAEVALSRAAAQLGRESDWRVAPVFGTRDAAAEPELSRHFMVTGRFVAGPALDPAAAAFEASHALDLGPGWEVKADAVSSVYAPIEDEEVAVALEEVALPDNWAIDALNCQEAWKLKPRTGGSAMGEGIVIGHPDTGFTDHPELERDMLDRVRDYDVLTGRDDAHAELEGFPPFRFPGHGTSTASAIASRRVGDVFGAAPMARLIPLRCARTVIRFRDTYMAMAIDAARKRGCHVVSISLGGILFSETLRAALQRGIEEGMIIMAAAGQPLPLVVAPASYRECLAIAGTVKGGGTWGMSARGPEIDVSAPAAKVPVASVENGRPPRFPTKHHTGTSFSVALTAGVAALWLAHNGRDALIEQLGGREHLQGAFRAAVRETVHKPPPDWDTKNWGAGIPNALDLLNSDPRDTGVAPSPAGEPDDPAQRVLQRAGRLITRATDEEAQAAVAGLFGQAEEGLRRFGDEILHWLGRDERLRDALAAGPTAALEEDSTARNRLDAVASPALRQALAG